MAKVPYSVEKLPKISIVWVGRTNVTDRQTDDRQTTDGRTTTYSEHELEFTFAKNCKVKAMGWFAICGRLTYLTWQASDCRVIAGHWRRQLDTMTATLTYSTGCNKPSAVRTCMSDSVDVFSSQFPRRLSPQRYTWMCGLYNTRGRELSTVYIANSHLRRHRFEARAQIHRRSILGQS